MSPAATPILSPVESLDQALSVAFSSHDGTALRDASLASWLLGALGAETLGAIFSGAFSFTGVSAAAWRFAGIGLGAGTTVARLRSPACAGAAGAVCSGWDWVGADGAGVG